MSATRAKFFGTLDAMVALSGDPLLVDLGPASQSHNNRARILRSGLVVSAFSHLEGFVAERFDEILSRLPLSAIPYAAFGDGMKSYLCVQAVRGLSKKISFMEDGDGLALAQSHLPHLAGFNAVPPTYSSLGATPKRTNMSVDDIVMLFRAFGLKKCWNRIAAICSHLGSARLNIQQDFVNFSRCRNRAAHDSATNIPTTDLQGHLQTALLLGMSIDLAISYAVESYIGALNLGRAEQVVSGLNIKIKFLDEVPGGGYEERGPKNRLIRTHASLTAALIAPSRPKTGFILRDNARLPRSLV